MRCFVPAIPWHPTVPDEDTQSQYLELSTPTETILLRSQYLELHTVTKASDGPYRS